MLIVNIESNTVFTISCSNYLYSFVDVLIPVFKNQATNHFPPMTLQVTINPQLVLIKIFVMKRNVKRIIRTLTTMYAQHIQLVSVSTWVRDQKIQSNIFSFASHMIFSY